MQKISVYIADNQTITRRGSSSLIEEHYNNNAEITYLSSKEDLLQCLLTNPPHLLIIDFDLFDFKNLNELIEIKNKFSSVGIMIFTDNQSPEDIVTLVNSGISVYLLKTCTEQEFIEGINATLAGKKFFSGEILDILFDQRSKSKSPSETGKLTLSEIEIVKLIAQGLTTKEIALHKHLSFHTIITHRKNIFRKLAISNQSELVMYAMRAGIIDTMDYYI
jgi:DNA-binding NarL/FixJ family response regulator